MRLRDDERGQAVQVGVVVLFGFLVVALASYQAVVVPQQNAAIEFDSYAEASRDVAELRHAMLATAGDGTVRGQTVTTGTDYPPRAFFVNPPPATGVLRTGDPATVALSNVAAVGEYPNVAEYFRSEGNSLNFTTSPVVFEPSYNAFDGAAPVVLANGVVYRDYANETFVADQTLIRSNHLRLVTVGGDLRAEGLAAAVTVSATSAHVRTVTVTNASGPFNVTVPTDLSERQWERLLASELDPAGTNPDRYVVAVTKPTGADYVNVTLEADARYELQIARLELRERSEPDAEGTPPARYLVTETDRNTQTNRNGRAKLVVEARDRYNNPVSDELVTFNASVGEFETADGDPVADASPAPGVQVPTNEAGRATVYFNATGHLGTIPVEAYLGTTEPPGTAGRKVTYSVFNSVLGGGGGSGEQAGRSLVVLQSTAFDPAAGTLELTFQNRGSFPANVTGYRLDYAVVFASQGNRVVIDGPEYIDYLTIDGVERPQQPAPEATKEGGSPHFFDDPVTIEGNETFTVTVHFTPGLTYDSNNAAGAVSMAMYLEGDLTVSVTVFDD